MLGAAVCIPLQAKVGYHLAADASVAPTLITHTLYSPYSNIVYQYPDNPCYPRFAHYASVSSNLIVSVAARRLAQCVFAALYRLSSGRFW